MSWMLEQKRKKLGDSRSSHKQGSVAATGSSAPISAQGDYAIWQAACKHDWDALKTIPDHAIRNKRKPALLEIYRDYLQKTVPILYHTPQQNDVLVRNLIWAMDAEDWAYALHLADACVNTQQTMMVMERDCTHFAADSILQAAEAAFKQAELAVVAPYPNASLLQTFHDALERIEQPERSGWVVNPFVLAKYCRLKARLEKDHDPSTALRYAETANTLDGNIGVKALLVHLRKQAPPTQAGGAEDSVAARSQLHTDESDPVTPVLSG